MPLLPVLHLRQGTHIWGPERGILQMMEHLPAHGFSVAIAVLCRAEQWGRHPFVVAARAQGAQAEELDAAWGAVPRVISKVTHRLRTEGFALLHTHEYKSSVLGGIAARRVGVPWVVTDHGLYTRGSWSKRLYRALELLALRGAAAISTPSEFQRRKLVAAGIPAERITVISHGLDPALWRKDANVRQATRRSFGLDDDTPVMLAMGRLEPVKGHRYLLQALSCLRVTFPRLRLWLAGEGSLYAELQRQAVTLGVADAVDLLGYRTDVPSLLAACDLFVLSSLEETLCWVILEAMAAGKPVIATRVGGLPEIVTDGEQGWLVPPANPQAMAAAIAEALTQPQEAARRAEAGARLVAARFPVSAMPVQVAQVYRQVLHGDS